MVGLLAKLDMMVMMKDPDHKTSIIYFPFRLPIFVSTDSLTRQIKIELILNAILFELYAKEKAAKAIAQYAV